MSIKSILLVVAVMLSTNPVLVSSSSVSGSIRIPSDPDIMGVKAVQYPHPKTRESWESLYKPGGFTDQTLENFCRGDKRGVFIVHSLEDIMGATTCFYKMWIESHLADRRTPATAEPRAAAEFHERFKDEFVSHYISYVLARRYIIAGSVVAFNDEPQFTLGETFLSVSFIMKVPPECIVMATPSDASSPVYYAHPKSQSYEISSQKVECTKVVDRAYVSGAAQSLDSIMRCPEIETVTSASDQYVLGMNEVAFLSCAVDEAGYIYRPEVVGVFINNLGCTWKGAYGSEHRNYAYIEAAKAYAEAAGLPIIDVSKEAPPLFSADQASKLLKERIDDPYALAGYIGRLPETKARESRFVSLLTEEIEKLDKDQDPEERAKLACANVLHKFSEFMRDINWLNHEKGRLITFRMRETQLAKYGLHF